MVVFCPTQAVCQCHCALDVKAEEGFDVDVGSCRRDADHRAKATFALRCGVHHHRRRELQDRQRELLQELNQAM